MPSEFARVEGVLVAVILCPMRLTDQVPAMWLRSPW